MAILTNTLDHVMQFPFNVSKCIHICIHVSTSPLNNETRGLRVSSVKNKDVAPLIPMWAEKAKR